MSSVPELSVRHLVNLMGPWGLFEHAEGTEPRPEHGYCTDDNARLLVVTSRRPDHGDCATLSRGALAFVLSALDAEGRAHNRMDTSGAWTDDATTDDCWGRSVWALGVAAALHDDSSVREAAAHGFVNAASQRARSPRTMAFAALGAVEVMSIDSCQRPARDILRTTLTTIGSVPSGDWCWPEPRLAYANAALAEALIATGSALNSSWDFNRGLQMLTWLLERETRGGHLSVAPAGGSGPSDHGPRFDQQPIEAAAMADACARAYALTGEASWARGVTAAARWFMGDNDAQAVMYDTETDGGYDGLHADGVNLNQGAESTLALLATMDRAHALVGSA